MEVEYILHLLKYLQLCFDIYHCFMVVPNCLLSSFLSDHIIRTRLLKKEELERKNFEVKIKRPRIHKKILGLIVCSELRLDTIVRRT